MKHESYATANALALIGGVWYILCVVWIAVSRSSYMEVMGKWFHGVDFKSLPPTVPTMGSITIGLITFVGFAWISGYVFAVFYNKFVKK